MVVLMSRSWMAKTIYLTSLYQIMSFFFESFIYLPKLYVKGVIKE